MAGHVTVDQHRVRFKIGVWGFLVLLGVTFGSVEDHDRTERGGCVSDCSENGLCGVDGKCVCDPGWRSSPDCSTLTLGPAAAGGVYGYGSPFQTTSWGGNSVLDNSTGVHHLYVTEIAGKGCGLHEWQGQSTVVHATSSSELGPYTRVGVAIPHQAHNPQTLLWGGKIYIFHIGTGVSTSTPKDCNEPVVPNTDWVTSTALPGPSSPPLPIPPARPGPSTGSSLHVASTFRGPFTPVQPGMPKCNNPSPAIHPNGTLYVACTWRLLSAPGPEGPWVEVGPIQPGNGSKQPNGNWEDPFLFFDRRGGWHVLAHVYAAHATYPNNPISGHAFSADGLNWTFSQAQPYSNAVLRVGGSVQMFATLERPKLHFNDASDPHRPTALFNGASPVWNASNQSNPCSTCGCCVMCKVTCEARGMSRNLDWTYTLGRPVLPVPNEPTLIN
jgi:hypothetical protein